LVAPAAPRRAAAANRRNSRKYQETRLRPPCSWSGPECLTRHSVPHAFCWLVAPRATSLLATLTQATVLCYFCCGHGPVWGRTLLPRRRGRHSEGLSVFQREAQLRQIIAGQRSHVVGSRCTASCRRYPCNGRRRFRQHLQRPSDEQREQFLNCPLSFP